jgi:hypothetical protein
MTPEARTGGRSGAVAVEASMPLRARAASDRHVAARAAIPVLAVLEAREYRVKQRPVDDARGNPVMRTTALRFRHERKSECTA